MSENTTKYIVTKKGALKHKVGDVVSLTEKQAKFMVGKIKLQTSVVKKKKVAFDATKKAKKTEDNK